MDDAGGEDKGRRWPRTVILSEDRFREIVLSVGPHLAANLKRIQESMARHRDQAQKDGGIHGATGPEPPAKVIERTMQGTRRMITHRVLSGSRLAMWQARLLCALGYAYELGE